MFIILYVSGLPTMWELMRQKPHDEIEEIMSKSSGDHEIYLEMQEITRSEEMNYVNAIIKESLRIHPPTTLTNFRKPSKPIKIGSYVVPKGVLCIMNIWQIHHNFKYWENPNQYKSR
ncbi:p450-domain-containing protein [Rhizophagus irregularis]|uniref:p450-domain-containing protein n=1 Tax=Rhizophagus irregularis TaxID=588596 RepID=A0A2N0RBV9_9GLOM|nr:p450-domain-containing protein [Rhizophagus irregularis]PKC60797.1 p450-domain-containing protein [Rhizophagus irregularis]